MSSGKASGHRRSKKNELENCTLINIKEFNQCLFYSFTLHSIQFSKNMEKVTAIIPTFNEEINIEKAIKSVLWADEILIVDSFSTDKTVEIARKYTDKILIHDYINSATQKNWAIPQATHPWIFLLDADERATVELEKEIKSILEKGTRMSAFWVRRKNYFMGKRLRFSGWQNDSVIRLFKREDCRYQDLKVHSEIETTGKIGKLQNKLVHNTYKNLGKTLVKLNRYSTWAAYDRADKIPRVTFYHIFIKPFWRFFKHYFIQLGILDGKRGLTVCVLESYFVFLRYVKLWRIHNGEYFNDER